jgi:uncharacterized protein (UPF0261 family)
MATVAILGTFDTKAEECAFLQKQVERAGCATILIDVGVTTDPPYRVEFSRSAVAAAAGEDIDVLIAAADRGRAVEVQGEGAAAIVDQLYREDRIDGILGIGGSGGTAIVSRAMRQVPVGLPKLLVSTMASGDTTPYVDTADITMMYSVVDFAGINDFSAQILNNAATGIAGMARGYEAYYGEGSDRPLVGATMYGTTTPCVESAREWLEHAGYEVLVFHATGPGGRAMEALMESGHIVAALDITPTEVMDELAGGTTTAGPNRLEMAGSIGLPQVVSLGAVEQITFRPPSAVPDEFADRLAYRHNPAVTLVRANDKEMARFGRVLSEKLNRATGPVSVFVPLRGLSSYDVAGEVFYDPEADEALFEALRTNLDAHIELVEMDTHINAPEFAIAMAKKLDALYRSAKASNGIAGEGEAE